MKKNIYDIENYMRKTGLEELETTMWVTDFYMNETTGKVIRDLPPTEVGIRYSFVKGNVSSKQISFHKIGQKEQVLKTTISVKSAVNEGIYSYLNVFENREEALVYFVTKKRESVKEYEFTVNYHNKFLEQLKKELDDITKN